MGADYHAPARVTAPGRSVRMMRAVALWTLPVVIAVSLAAAWVTRDRLPRTILIATGHPQGMYYEFWSAVRPLLEEHTGHRVELVRSSGSPENRALLDRGEAHLAIVQGDYLFATEPPKLGDAEIVAPLYPQPVTILTRRDSGIRELADLEGRTVFLGSRDSGTHITAEAVLDHYGVSVVEPHADVADFIPHPTEGGVDAVVVTTGVRNQRLNEMLATGDYQLVPIPNAEGFAARSVDRRATVIPAGFFRGQPATPARPVETVATTAFVIVEGSGADALASALLPVLYDPRLRTRFPAMVSRQEALDWCPVDPHPAARAFFDPVDRLGTIAATMESIAATKELLFALGAGLFLLWRRAERVARKQRDAALRAEKDRLDVLLQQTLEIEQQQMHVEDPVKLRALLDRVTSIKLEALRELAEEELLADQAFSIFLIQCSNLINKIQMKIISLARAEA